MRRMAQRRVTRLTPAAQTAWDRATCTDTPSPWRGSREGQRWCPGRRAGRRSSETSQRQSASAASAAPAAHCLRAYGKVGSDSIHPSQRRLPYPQTPTTSLLCMHGARLLLPSSSIASTCSWLTSGSSGAAWLWLPWLLTNTWHKGRGDCERQAPSQVLSPATVSHPTLFWPPLELDDGASGCTPRMKARLLAPQHRAGHAVPAALQVQAPEPAASNEAD